MASTVQQSGSQQYVDFDEFIDYQLQKTRGNIKSNDVLTAFAFVAVFVLAYLFLFVVGDHYLVEDGFSQSTRILLLSFVGLVSAGWLVWKVVWPYLRQVNRLFAAKLIERSQPELHSTLLNLIDARDAGKEVPPEIIAAMEKRAAISMSHANVDDAVDRRPLMWACYAVLGLVVLFSLYTIFTPKKVSASLWRALFPVSAVDAPTQTIIENVTPGDTEVIPGTRLEVLADVKGEIPEEITLRYSTSDREFVDEPIEMREVPDFPNRYRAEIIGRNGEGIQQNLTYHIIAGDDRSQSYAVTVAQPPTAEIVELHYTYPKYMARKPKTLPTGNIDDYEGAIVTFLAEGNMPLKSATIAFHDDIGTDYSAKAIPMTPINAKRTQFRANWVLSFSAKRGTYPRYYTIECKNENGVSDPNPARWPIRIHRDLPPEVQIVNPQESLLERPANAILPITAAARDDFQVSYLALWKQLNDGKPVEHRVLFRGSEGSLSADYEWRLNEGWNLKPGDRVSYWAQAHDNREPHAGKVNTEKQSILILEERPEDEIQQQLENDRRPEQKQQEPSTDPSQKNPDETPNEKSPRPEDDGSSNEKRDPMQPMDQEQPSQKQDSESGEDGNSDSDNADANQKGSGTEKSENADGGGSPVKNDGSQDDKALESLHRHLNEDQNESNDEKPENNNQNDTGEGTPGENKTPMPGENDPNTKRENAPNQKPGENDPGKEKPTEDSEMPMDSGNSKSPDPMKPGKNPRETMGDETASPDKPPMKYGTDNAAKPGSEEKMEPKSNATPDGMETDPQGKDPMSDPMNPSGKKPNADPNSDPNATPGETSPSKGSDPNAQKTNEGPMGTDTEPSADDMGTEAEKPLNGTEEPTDPDKNAERRTPDGKEQGPATSETDPDADTKQAENKLERKDPEKPTTTKKRDGNPEDVPGEKPKQTNEKPPQENRNPDERPGKAPDVDPERDPMKSKNQPNMGEDDLQGKGRPKGQRSEKPDGGEAGGGKQNREGTPGGDEKGTGDPTPKPSDKDPSNETAGGKPGDQKGEGSTTRPTENTEDKRPMTGDPPADQKLENQPAPKPSEDPQPGGRGSQGETRRPEPNGRTGETGPPDLGNRNGNERPATPDAAQAAEEANLEYGREATDLALKKLENEIQRGDVNEEWLKEMGWDKADAEQFLDRMKSRLNSNEDSSPEALARKRQFNEWLKRLNKPKTATNRREGSTVRNRSPRELIDTRTSAPPAELRDLYEAYQRGISERSQ